MQTAAVMLSCIASNVIVAALLSSIATTCYSLAEFLLQLGHESIASWIEGVGTYNVASTGCGEQ